MTEPETNTQRKRPSDSCARRRRLFNVFRVWMNAPHSECLARELRQAMEERELRGRLCFVLPVTTTSNGA